MELTIPGSVYYDALDPLCSGMAEEIGLPEPSTRRRGRGLTFIYSGVTAEQAREVADYIGPRAEMLLAQGDLDSYERTPLRAALEVAERIRGALRPA